MLEVSRRIEQLELIAKLLDEDTPSSARLAAIVADNFAEIIMYHKVIHEFASEQVWRNLRPPRWAPEKRRKVLDDFDAKVNFLMSEIGAIDADDAEFLKYGHWIRNRAYHTDAYHADVISVIARTYFSKVCRLYPQLRFPGVAYSGSQREAHFLKRYGLSEPAELIHGGLARICDGLASPRDCPATDLAAGLSNNLVRRIEAIIGTSEEYGFLDTLLDGKGQSDADKDDVLKRIQFADYYEPDPNPTKLDEGFCKAIARRKAEFASYATPVTVQKLRRWKDTAVSIAKETTFGRAVKRFKSLDEQFSSVEDLVHRAIGEFDEWVNSQIKG